MQFFSFSTCTWSRHKLNSGSSTSRCGTRIQFRWNSSTWSQNITPRIVEIVKKIAGRLDNYTVWCLFVQTPRALDLLLPYNGRQKDAAVPKGKQDDFQQEFRTLSQRSGKPLRAQSRASWISNNSLVPISVVSKHSGNPLGAPPRFSGSRNDSSIRIGYPSARASPYTRSMPSLWEFKQQVCWDWFIQRGCVCKRSGKPINATTQ